MPSPVKDAYLVVYNLACAGGWSYVLLACVSHILAGSEPQALYDEVEKVLQVVQTAALMEVRLCLLATTVIVCLQCAVFSTESPPAIPPEYTTVLVHVLCVVAVQAATCIHACI